MKFVASSDVRALNEAARVFFVYSDGEISDALKGLDGSGVIATYAEKKSVFGVGNVRLFDVDDGRVVVVGLGKEDDFDALVLRKALFGLYGALKKEKLWVVDVVDVEFGDWDAEESARRFVEASYFAAYEFVAHKSKGKEKKWDVHIVGDGLMEAVEKGDVVGRNMSVTRNFSNEAPNLLYPEQFAARAAELFEGAQDVEIEVLDEKQMREMGMGLISGVGQGSTRPPRMVLIRYAGGQGDEYSAVVGKGITFDTGGISLKVGPAASTLTHMKRDMAGASAVVGLMKSLVELGVRRNVVGVLCLAENMPDGGSFRPSDVLTAYNGKTVEIESTDAEGRLAMADGIAYVQDKYEVKELIDVATLTGEVWRSFGYLMSAVFTNEDGMYEGLANAGQSVGEYTWRMPLFEHYAHTVKGDFADLHELSMKMPNAINSALFLKQFVEDGVRFAHIDIAGSEGLGGGEGVGSSGVGVRLLTRYFESL